MVTAAERRAYYPIAYVYPNEGNEAALSFDLALKRDSPGGGSIEPGIRADQSRRGGSLWCRTPNAAWHFWSFSRFTRAGCSCASVEERRSGLTGFVVGVFRIGDMVNASLSTQERHAINLRLTDLTEPNEPVVLYDEQSGSSAADEGHPQKQSDLGLRRQKSWIWPGAGGRSSFLLRKAMLAGNPAWQAWSVLVAGLLFTSVLGAFLLLVTGRAARTEQLVSERTADLESANLQLQSEIAAREQTEAAASEKRGILSLSGRHAATSSTGQMPRGTPPSSIPPPHESPDTRRTVERDTLPGSGTSLLPDPHSPVLRPSIRTREARHIPRVPDDHTRGRCAVAGATGPCDSGRGRDRRIPRDRAGTLPSVGRRKRSFRRPKRLQRLPAKPRASSWRT